MAYFLTVLVLVSLAALFGALLFGRGAGSVRKPVDWTRRVLSGEIPYEKVVIDVAKWIAPLWMILIVLVLAAIIHLFLKLVGGVEAEDLRFHYLAIGSMFLVLGGLIGTPLAIIRVWTGERQTRTIEQGHVTDRLTKAIEQLGSEKTVKRTITGEDGTAYVDESTAPNIEVRLGAIYALERIAQDSQRDHIPVMETLCAYVRENATAHIPTEDKPTNRPRADIRAVLDVLSRRRPERIAHEESFQFKLDLSFTNLAHRDLTGLSLASANLRKTRLEGAILNLVQIEGADLFNARLEGTYLMGAQLSRTNLGEARMKGADCSWAELVRANLRWAWLEEADLFNARLEGANLSEAQLKGANLFKARLGGAYLSGAQMEGADLREADFRSAEWAGGYTSSPAHSADLRGAIGLTQARLDTMIGNKMTLLPDGLALDTGASFSIPSTWADPPPFFDAMVGRMGRRWPEMRSAEQLAAAFLSPEGEEPIRTGTCLALDAPYPEGHPLADRDDWAAPL